MSACPAGHTQMAAVPETVHVDVPGHENRKQGLRAAARGRSSTGAPHRQRASRDKGRK